MYNQDRICGVTKYSSYKTIENLHIELLAVKMSRERAGWPSRVVFGLAKECQDIGSASVMNRNLCTYRAE